jgi:hypothetical protein
MEFRQSWGDDLHRRVQRGRRRAVADHSQGLELRSQGGGDHPVPVRHVLATVQSKLGFERKWIANRMTHNSLKRLQIDEKTGASMQEVKDKLKTILEEHDRAITAMGSA